jgi:hypothetical protein
MAVFESFENWPELAGLRADLEGHADAIGQEARALLAPDCSALSPWREPEIYEGGWDVLGLFWGGREMERRSKAPLTKSILESWLPLVFNAGFSALRPGARIKPHVGYTADVLRLHLGAVVPSSDPQVAGLRVGSQTRGWQEGACLLFDDTQEHAAWNLGASTRVVLLVDLLRPVGREKGRIA